MTQLDDFCFCLGGGLLQVSDQLCAKYSQDYGQLCRTNEIGTVNARVTAMIETHGLLILQVWEKLSTLGRVNHFVKTERWG